MILLLVILMALTPAVDKTKYDSISKRLSMDPAARVSLAKLELVSF